MRDEICKKCRAVGEKLFLKGEKCYTPKCPMVRRGIAFHGKNKRKPALTPYGRQLLEKQKAKLIYGIREKQLQRYFNLAYKKQGATPIILAQILESRLDNVIVRAGFVSNRASARQLISHGCFLLNGRKHNISSTILKHGDIVSVNPNVLQREIFKNIKEKLTKNNPPKFIEVDPDKLTITIVKEPDLEELKMPIDFPSIVEFYSK
ncbi:MAG: 30S ribosomal protein S4 [Parcubacteria group bacterium]|nr:30S ribosomal protein S4 [Parcubacteria group bacterium]